MERERKQLQACEVEDVARNVKSKVAFLRSMVVPQLRGQEIRLDEEASRGFTRVLDDMLSQLDELADAEIIVSGNGHVAPSTEAGNITDRFGFSHEQYREAINVIDEEVAGLGGLVVLAGYLDAPDPIEDTAMFSQGLLSARDMAKDAVDHVKKIHEAINGLV